MVADERFTLPVGAGDRLACRWSRPAAGGAATLVYLHGFGSSQEGEKATFFRERCGDLGLEFFSFDLRGHGASTGGMKGLTLTRCLEDLDAVSSFLVARKRIRRVLLGSSMGGLIGLWQAARSPEGWIAGLHIAPAVGLAEGFQELLGEEGMDRWRREGVLEVVNELGTFHVGWGLVTDLERYPTDKLAELHRVPSVLFQGRRDDRVSWRRVAAFCRAATGEARLRLFEDGDHRLLAYRDRIWGEMRGFLVPRLAGGDPALQP